MRLLACALLLFVLPVTSLATPVPALDKVARSYAKRQPALERYAVTVQTDRIRQTLAQMTAQLPADVERPPQPVVRKYWLRSSGKSLVRAEGPNVFPLMQQMAQRFARDLSLELFDFFLPVGKGGERDRLLDQARVAVVESDLAGVHVQTVTLNFAEPANLNGAFYGRGLGLPQTGIVKLVIDLDPRRELVTRMEISTREQIYTLEARYREVSSGWLPTEVLLTSFDGSTDVRLETEFDQVDGIWLPVRQKRSVRRGDKSDNLEVVFADYQVNKPFSPEVEKLLAP